MQHSKLIALALTASMLTACTEPTGEPGRGVMQGGAANKSDIGTAAGAIGGGVLGYQFGGGAGKALATVGGALLGGILGRSVGTSLDNADRAAYDDASQYALENGSRHSWRNPDSGHYGTIYPDRRYVDDEGRYCREYRQTIVIDGRTHEGHGLACREEDGTWQIIE
jgi:surface antigen